MDSEQNYENFLGNKVADHVTAMLAYWDKDLICRFANAAYLDWFGKRQEDMINKITIKELLGPLYEQNLPYISAVLKGNAQTFEREIPIPTGGTRHSLASYYPDFLNGEVKGFFVHVADVAPIKLLEKELTQSIEIIKQQNKHLLNFANIVSHNLRSYSSNLALILDLFTSAGSEKEKNEMFDYLKSISSGFSSTVDHLNEIVKLQNQDKINFEKINLHQYIEKSIQVLRIQIKSNNAILQNKVNTSVSLLVNPAYMESILLNFLTNAIKYSHPDRPPIIELSSFIEDNKTVLNIKDNGKGLNLEKHGADLFTMYKTFHGNSDAQGIGLFITKFQVEAMGGQIRVESKENEGSIFSIFFNSVLQS